MNHRMVGRIIAFPVALIVAVFLAALVAVETFVHGVCLLSLYWFKGDDRSIDTEVDDFFQGL